MPETFVPYRRAEQLTRVSVRSMQRWKAEGLLRWRLGRSGRTEVVLEDVRRVKREKAARNVPLQRMLEKRVALVDRSCNHDD